jgi:hypothetical protein
LDVNAELHRVDETTLPWSYTMTTGRPAVIGQVVVDGDSDSIGSCSVMHGEVEDEGSVNAVNAQTFCPVRSA